IFPPVFYFSQFKGNRKENMGVFFCLICDSSQHCMVMSRTTTFSIEPKYMPYVAYANIWGLPALTIPLNSNQDGNPISLQIMSAIGNEDTIFNLGEVIEDYFSGYRRSTLYDQSPVS